MLLAKGAAIDGPIAVAWDGRAQSARAARAALPLLQAAPGVLIVRNTDDATSESEASAPERLRTYLAQHGVADVALRAVRGDRVADSLLKAAQADGCGVLVAGAFGRPRLFEMALGGTTRALVKAEGGPNIMLAH